MRNVGQVAQLVEQLTLNQLVKGSSPFLPTILSVFQILFIKYHSKNMVGIIT